MDVRVGLWRRLSAEELMLSNCGVGEDSWESLGLQGDPTSPFWRRWALGFLWKEWCWSWSSSTLATSCEELTHWKRPRCWDGLGAGGEGDDRGWDGWMASLTGWTWVWVNSGSWWWTGRPGMLWFMGSKRVGHDWATELNWISACIAFLGLHNKVPQTRWLKQQQKYIFSQFWNLEVQDQNVIGLISFWGLSPWLEDGCPPAMSLPSSLCFCVQISFSYKDTSHVGLWSTQKTLF